MFETVGAGDRVLHGKLFMAEEVPNNLLHLICESNDALRLKSVDDTMIFAQTKGFNAWLWLAKEVTKSRREVLFRQLIDDHPALDLPGVTGEPWTAEYFAQMYSEARRIHYESYMVMESYYCPEVKKPIGVIGEMRRAWQQDVDVVADFLVGFSQWAFEVEVTKESQIPAAERMIGTGNLYLWCVDDHTVSMANIAHRSPRHARINSVYTPVAHRKKGYASAVVAEVCSLLRSENLVPMLYADLKNPDSNKVYRSVGFIEGGKIADFKFKDTWIN
ncbi:GNAT family N-acetyltransferase [Paenibacillus bouchesdurhonensis]|uniref:GNAT family N-acetyltransferase n=1 Tax=Paenibacillus bouchesdurhonensis TaxID=1870990 RepID=UPI000DA622C7|nr:GNAT family N-acetyltransferase [Paenibacillus bouchesdurhonensis]